MGKQREDASSKDTIRPLDTFGARLRYARELRGFGSRELSTRVGLSSAAVSRLECVAGAEPTIDNVRLLAEALECSPGWLAFGEGPAPE